jgi:uncharacterized protein GlcG (DUF336 family)
MAQTFSKRTISSEAAHQIISASEARAAEMGKPFTIAVVDGGGALKAFSRVDGFRLTSVKIAQDKAYTAVAFGMDTDRWLA